MPFFSIIIPTFNSAGTIEKCIESVLAQDFSNYEILIQDGKSSDETLQLIGRYQDERIKLVSGTDTGIYNAMNRAVKRTTGEWLFFLGSDDRLYNQTVLSEVEMVISQNNNTRFLYGDVMTSDNVLQRYNDYNFKRLLFLNICHQAIFYQVSLFHNKDYDEKFKLMADWDFNLRVFKKPNNPVYLNLPVAYYNLLGESASWYDEAEYIRYFSNKRWMLLKYGGILEFLKTYFKRITGISSKEN